MSETTGNACGPSWAPHGPVGPLLGLGWALIGVLGRSGTLLCYLGLCYGGRAESPDTADTDVRNVWQSLRPLMGPSWVSWARLWAQIGTFMGLLGCLGTLLGHSGHSRHGCQKRPATQAASHGRLLGLLGPSKRSVGPLMGVFGRLGTLLGHFGAVLGAAHSLRTQPTWMSQTSGNACGLSWAPHCGFGALLGPLLGPSWVSWAVFGRS